MAAAKKPDRETNPTVLKQGMLRRLPRRTSATGQIVWPVVPSLLDHYATQCHTIFAALGRVFSATEMARVKEILKDKIDKGFARSPYSKVVVDYKTDPPPKTTLTYTISYRVITIADEYAEWVKNRTPPLFGAHPDTKIMELAASLGSPSEVTALDVGAGTGRNTIPLAKAGYATDAVELAPALAQVLREDVEKAGLAVRVFEGNALDPELPVPRGHYKMVVLAEVVASHFRSVAELRTLFERAAEWLAPGGTLLFSLFLTSGGYKPDALAREMSEVMWCCLFTRHDLDQATEGLPFTRTGDESVHDFEQAHLPETAWPPTGWFVQWTRGLDLFDIPADKSPLELRWVSYRRND
jgi:SAM-dependent methyltransferase